MSGCFHLSLRPPNVAWISCIVSKRTLNVFVTARKIRVRVKLSHPRIFILTSVTAADEPLDEVSIAEAHVKIHVSHIEI